MVETTDGSSAARHVLDRLLNIEHDGDDERWLLLDTDHCIQGSHLAGFTEALAEARRHGIKVALSKPSFELWLLTHHVDETAVMDLETASAVEEALRRCLGGYNKTKLKREHYPTSSVYDACVRAERLDRATCGEEIPSRNTTRVYQLWKSIVAKAIASQLPRELQKLLSAG